MEPCDSPSYPNKVSIETTEELPLADYSSTTKSTIVSDAATPAPLHRDDVNTSSIISLPFKSTSDMECETTLFPGSTSSPSKQSASSPPRTEDPTTSHAKLAISSQASTEFSIQSRTEDAPDSSNLTSTTAETTISPIKLDCPSASTPDDGKPSSPGDRTADLLTDVPQQDLAGGTIKEPDCRQNERPSCDPSPAVLFISSDAERTAGTVEPPASSQVLLQHQIPMNGVTNSPVDRSQTAVPKAPSDSPQEETILEPIGKRGPKREFSFEQPAKRAKTNGNLYSGADAVKVALGQTAEIVLILAGMAQMRAGTPPTSLEIDLAATAYQNLGALVSKVAPNSLVSRESLEVMLHEFDLKRTAREERENQAWAEALAEAESVAKAKAEALARAQAEELARAKTEAEAEERERQVALKAAALVANGDGRVAPPSGGLLPPIVSSGQLTLIDSKGTESSNLSTPAVNVSTQAESISRVGDLSSSETASEKSLFVNGQSQQTTKTPVGKPPKVRNRAKKDSNAVTLFTPELLAIIQNQIPEAQKAQVTHKQLGIAVQQFIREHFPSTSQILQALPPHYMNTPTPCQVCKLIAKDTGSVLVCDSCEQVTHVKCVQPLPSKGVPKGDWNCSKCMSASGGRLHPPSYGSFQHGSSNSVKLWAPHNISDGNAGPIAGLANGSFKTSDVGLAMDGRQIGVDHHSINSGSLRVEIESGAHQSRDEKVLGNYGGSPHLIVHLVNEPSPRTSEPLQVSSRNFGKDDVGRPLVPVPLYSSAGESQSNLVSREENTCSGLMLEGRTQAETTTQNNGVNEVEPIGSIQNTGRSSEYLSGVQETQAGMVPEPKVSQVNTRAGDNQLPSLLKGSDSAKCLPGKQVDVPITMEWVGDSDRTMFGKVYYKACRVGGITYFLSDCALFRPETPDVPPYIARLQVLWEDISTGHKWVRVSWCYYPNDIPIAMGRPGLTEPDEVYESNHCDNNLVGSIQGPCLVLSPQKFQMEKERRRELHKSGGILEELPPIFLSRWLYDAPKGVFKAVTE